MSMQDPIADMLTRIRNAQAAQKKFVMMPSSKQKVAISKVLLDEGYIGGYEAKQEGSKSQLKIDLKYYNGQPVIARLDRVSRPGLRVYRDKNSFPVVLGGLGVTIVSNSKGVMTSKAAIKIGQGGEVLCVVE